MTENDAIEMLKVIQTRQSRDKYDQESDHIDADEVLCTLLTELGYSKVIAEYNLIYKWYA